MKLAVELSVCIFERKISVRKYLLTFKFIQFVFVFRFFLVFTSLDIKHGRLKIIEMEEREDTEVEYLITSFMLKRFF